MKPLLAVFRARFHTLLQYRGAAIGGLITQIFFGFIYVTVFRALFANSTEMQPMALDQVVTYLWLNQAIFALQPWNPDGEVRQMIRTGAVAYELTRPCEVYWLWYARAFALRSAPTLLRAVPLVTVAMLFLGMKPPAGVEALLCFLASFWAAVALSAAITVLLNASLFWTLSGDGLVMLMPATVMALSGQLIPLPFYPAWLQPFLHALPFRGLVDVPLRIYNGSIPPAQALVEIGLQLGWCVALVIAGRLAMARGIRQLVVQGG